MISKFETSSIRHFNRYYSNKLGLLARYRFDTRLTLTEARVLYEIGRRGEHALGALGEELRIDGGYLSRVVARLASLGLVERRENGEDRRVSPFALTEEGRKQVAAIDAASDEDALDLVSELSEAELEELVGHMRAIERILEGLSGQGAAVERAESRPALAAARALIREYVASLGEDLDYQGIEEELAGLPGKYASPGGALFLARLSGRRDRGEDSARGADRRGESAGCVALRPLGAGACEMKRLYVRPEYRGYGIGRSLALRAIDEARDLGYERIRLDTLERLGEAVGLYRSLGFAEIPPYCENPLAGAMFWEKSLR